MNSEAFALLLLRTTLNLKVLSVVINEPTYVFYILPIRFQCQPHSAVEAIGPSDLAEDVPGHPIKSLVLASSPINFIVH